MANAYVKGDSFAFGRAANQLRDNLRQAAADLGDISEEEILKTVREYRSGQKKLPEITVVARTKKQTA
jgi:hypothetical protein